MGLFSGIVDALFGSDAPEPDPNIGISQRELSELARNQQTFFQENFAPRLLNQMDQQIGLSSRQANSQEELQDFQMGLARKYDDRYWGTTAKYEDKFRGLVDQFSQPDEYERQAGQAGADVAQAFSSGNRQLGRGMARMGVNPSSDAAAGGYRSMMNEQSLAQAGAMNAARQAARDLGLRYTAAAAGMGGQMIGATQGAAGGAGAAGMNAVNAGAAGMGAINSAQQGFNANNQMVGNMWNNVGNLGLGVYQGRLQGYNSQQEVLGSLLGAAGTFAGAKWG